MQEMQETQFWSLSREDPLGEEMTTHSSLLAWEIPWTEEPEGLQSKGHKDSDRIEHIAICNGVQASVSHLCIFPLKHCETS